MLTFIIGPFLSLLPQRWRRHLFPELDVNWVRATMISGVAMGFGCMLALVLWYLAYITAASEAQAAATLEAMGQRGTPQGMTNVGASYAMGLGGLLAFALHPLTWALAYFSAEGVYRGFAAMINEEAPGSGPLALVDWTVRSMQRRAYEKRVPLLPDKVTLDREGKQWNLKVESCRPKTDWKYPKVVKYREGFFQVAGETDANASPDRPHIYLLRSVPAGEAYRGMEIYDPSQVVKQQPELTAGRAAMRAIRDGLRLKTLPLVADEVERVVNEEGVYLRITSCRPKQDWTEGRVIRFEGCFYRMSETYEAESPRPFGFVLHLVPTGVAGRRTIDYSPDDVLKQPQA